ncbi:MAG TPA: c-type cytochrome [Gemmatales bacterium]|nr:c-type cytochrome [Gemmatales bacterium]HMP58141.1 c-type cytochrome [Gemmatales bacterium]
MAARDDFYRSQKILDIVFALSCVAMLLSLIWMFAADHNREYKSWQRTGRDAEVALLDQKVALEHLLSLAKVNAAKKAIVDALAKIDSSIQLDPDAADFLDQAKRLAATVADEQIAAWSQELDRLRPEYVRMSERLASSKAVRDSIISQRDIMLHQGAAAAAIAAKEQEVRTYENDYVNRYDEQFADMKVKVGDLEEKIATARKEVVDAVARLEEVNREADRIARLADQRRYGIGARVRGAPILDFMNPPFKVVQHIPDGLTIDYNFKHVQRVDRCASCHLFIDRPGFEKEALRDLHMVDGDVTRFVELHHKGESRSAEENEEFEQLKAAAHQLGDDQVSVFCNHPRLDLFVGSNSPHSAEKFGCTICHAGQGGSASFNFAYHYPDGSRTNGHDLEHYDAKLKRWQKTHHWEADLHPNFLWDQPQVPLRFIESSCLKCHHQVTDLIRTDGKEEAPKLLRGFRLVRDLGCFGCHEISGFKGGRSIGPDMRLEPYPPLDDLSPADRAKALSDPTDPPGTYRKNGPGLRRLAEKADADWIARWIRSPRSFRPETRMPHYYGQHNNNPHRLSDDLDGETQLPKDQMGYPDAELRAMTFYLLKASESQLQALRTMHALSPSEWSKFQEEHQGFLMLAQIRADNPSLTPRDYDPEVPGDLPEERLINLSATQRKLLTKDQLDRVLEWFAERERLRQAAASLVEKPFPPTEVKDYTANPKNGEQLFQLKGCLACHGHETVRDSFKNDEKMADLLNEARYGPSLVGLREKLAFDKQPNRAKAWLYYWLTNPSDYHPRTFMPNPMLEPQERWDLVAWLLEDRGNVAPPQEWTEIQVSNGDVDGMVLDYLRRALPTRADAERAKMEGLADVRFLRPDADERLLAKDQPAGSMLAGMTHDERKLYYLGRKTIARNGCYACHDIPGFETAKPIGVALNDWGKKESDRLDYANIDEFVYQHYPNYDQFHIDAMKMKRRDGFLHQKLKDPRSYDWGKLKERPWDDRLKMPQFKFARLTRKPGESEEAFRLREDKEEQEAREAVMTFILGLVAEPIPLNYVHQPRADRLQEVVGLKVLEKYNCVGCHVLKPGSYEFSLTEEARGATLHEQLLKLHRDAQEELQADRGFPESNAWRSKLQYPPGRVVIRALPRAVDEENELLSLEPWEAIHFPKPESTETLQLPVKSVVTVPLESTGARHAPYGGLYTDIHMRIIGRLENKNLVGDRPELMGSAPPPLMRQGQKVQPRWLSTFLQEPIPLRPSVYRHLRMPQFNMSPEEAQALVDYFVAVDRLQNPAVGAEYTVPRPIQQNPAEIERLRAEFRAKLRQYTDLSDAEIAQRDYFEAGWQLLTNRQLCLQCHNAGTWRADGELVGRGPSFHLAPDRLQPDYIHRWVSVPPRLIPYTKMNWFTQFYHQPNYPALQAALKSGPVRVGIQLTPLLDALSAPVAGFRPPLPLADGVYHQLQAEFALTPDEKVRAARDAILSWGHLPNPPPTAVKAGPRPDGYTGEKP